MKFLKWLWAIFISIIALCAWAIVVFFVYMISKTGHCDDIRVLFVIIAIAVLLGWYSIHFIRKLSNPNYEQDKLERKKLKLQRQQLHEEGKIKSKEIERLQREEAYREYRKEKESQEKQQNEKDKQLKNKEEILAQDNISKVYTVSGPGAEKIAQILCYVLDAVFLASMVFVMLNLFKPGNPRPLHLVIGLSVGSYVVIVLLMYIGALFAEIYTVAQHRAFVTTIYGRLYYCKISPAYAKSHVRFTRTAKLIETIKVNYKNKEIRNDVKSYMQSDKFLDDIDKLLHREPVSIRYELTFVHCENYKLIRRGIFQDTIEYYDAKEEKNVKVKIHHNFGLSL